MSLLNSVVIPVGDKFLDAAKATGAPKWIAEQGMEIWNLIDSGFLNAESAASKGQITRAKNLYIQALGNKSFRQAQAAKLKSSGTAKTINDVGERPIVTPESLQGRILTPVSGDTTVVGQAVDEMFGYSVDGVKVDGGPMFGLAMKDAVVDPQNELKRLGWASMEDAANKKQAGFDWIADKTGNTDISGVYTPMTDIAMNFASPLSEITARITQQLDGIPKKVIKQFDEAMRNGSGKKVSADGKVSYTRDPFPNWVGIQHQDAVAQLTGSGDFPQDGAGALRKAYMAVSASKGNSKKGQMDFRQYGVPNRGTIVEAITEPQLQGGDKGSAGFSIFDAVAGADTIPFGKNKFNQSYDTGMEGYNPRGHEVFNIPPEVYFSDMMGHLAKQTNTSGTPFNRNEQIGSFMMNPNIYQRADQQWLDGVMDYTEKETKRLSDAKSGILPTVAAGAGGLLAMAGSEDSEASFIGPLAKTFNHEALRLAKQLTSKGMGEDGVWAATGKLGSPTFRDVDGRWKQEISDEGYKYTEPKSLMNSIEIDSIKANHNFIYNASTDDLAQLAKGEDFKGTPEEYREWALDNIYTDMEDITQGTFKSSEVNSHPELEAAYPDIFSGNIQYRDRIGADDLTLGSFNPVTGDSTLKTNAQDMRSTMAHEGGHWVQEKEDFARGGNRAFFERKNVNIRDDVRALTEQRDAILTDLNSTDRFVDIDAKMAELRLVADNPDVSILKPDGSMDMDILGQKIDASSEIDKLQAKKTMWQSQATSTYDDAIDRVSARIQDPHTQYRNLAGEAEARNLQERLDMTMDERIATPPWQTLDRVIDGPRDKLSVIGQRFGQDAPMGAKLAMAGGGGLLASGASNASAIPLDQLYNPASLGYIAANSPTREQEIALEAQRDGSTIRPSRKSYANEIGGFLADELGKAFGGSHTDRNRRGDTFGGILDWVPPVAIADALRSGYDERQDGNFWTGLLYSGLGAAEAAPFAKPAVKAVRGLLR